MTQGRTAPTPATAAASLPPRASAVPDAAVSLRAASVRLGGRWIWERADLTVEPGEFLVVLGPNGAGKTTLLRVLLGLVPLASGSASVFGADPRHARPVVGYVPQRRTFDRDLFVRARDLVALGVDGTRWGVSLSGRERRMRQALVEEALEAVGAVDFANRPVGHLSGGEQQRLLLAQALVTRPRLLLLDEPLASLDLGAQAQASALVSSVARARGITVILVAHDVNPLVSVLDRVAYVARGRITAGPPDEVITSQRLSELYDHQVEVLRDRFGRIVVVGLEDVDSHHF
ncbi:MAG: ABC transporter ATP-binding protein [Candidatus Dormibacteraeota bacterium]|nr:ABC transporter ATP-binding protein [Candidatus Dormibacteraeota bacterium]